MFPYTTELSIEEQKVFVSLVDLYKKKVLQQNNNKILIFELKL